MNYKVFISFVLAALMLCSCKNSKPEAAQNADAQSEVTGSADSPETQITAEMAFEGVNNYCHEKFDWTITEENPDIMYVTMGEETDSAYQVVFRSYTGSLTHFYVDKLTGKTRMVTKVPNLGVEEDDGTIDLHDYLGKVSSSDKEASTTNESLTGHFVSDLYHRLKLKWENYIW